MGWQEAADLIVKGLDGAIAAKTVTYDFARLMAGAKKVKTSQFADAMIEHVGRARTIARTAKPARLATNNPEQLGGLAAFASVASFAMIRDGVI